MHELLADEHQGAADVPTAMFDQLTPFCPGSR
jgi:hypothetical protein